MSEYLHSVVLWCGFGLSVFYLGCGPVFEEVSSVRFAHRKRSLRERGRRRSLRSPGQTIFSPKRGESAVDLDALVNLAAEHNAAIKINANSFRPSPSAPIAAMANSPPTRTKLMSGTPTASSLG